MKWNKWTIGLSVVGLMIVVPIGFSIIGSITSIATAPGRVLQRTMNTDNIIHNYEWFHDTFTAYESRVSQIATSNAMFKEVTAEAEKTRMRMEIGAQKQTCKTLVARYNSNSEKMNVSIFKGWSLPKDLNMESCN